MEMLLLAVTIYTLVYGADYLYYVKYGAAYDYTSWRTWLLFTAGQLSLITLFFPALKPFFAHFNTELVAILILTVVMVGFAYVFHVNHLLICHFASRSERCLTPAYVLVKGADIVLHQITFLVIALTLKDMGFGTFYSYILFIAVVVIMHTPVVLNTSRDIAKMLSFGVAILAIPSFYTFTALEYFWPAVYLHSLVYMFIWLVFADMEGQDVSIVDK